MDYQTLRENAATGDIILFAGTDFISKVVRVFTASQYSHIGVLVWEDDGLWLAEMTVSDGYKKSPASQVIKKMCEHGYVWYGNAPAMIDMLAVQKEIQQFRDGFADLDKDPNYSWITLLMIGWSKVTNTAVDYRYVCSTFVQDLWDAGGIRFKLATTPSDFSRRCDVLNQVKM